MNDTVRRKRKKIRPVPGRKEMAVRPDKGKGAGDTRNLVVRRGLYANKYYPLTRKVGVDKGGERLPVKERGEQPKKKKVVGGQKIEDWVPRLAARRVLKKRHSNTPEREGRESWKGGRKLATRRKEVV